MGIELDIKITTPLTADDKDLLSGVAVMVLAMADREAYMADRVAAFGGAIALNREVDRATAEAVAAQYAPRPRAPRAAPGRRAAARRVPFCSVRRRHRRPDPPPALGSPRNERIGGPGLSLAPSL